MPRTTMIHVNPNNNVATLENDQGGCFGYMASTSYFRNRNDVKYVVYHLESLQQQQICAQLFPNNIFPHHNYYTREAYLELCLSLGTRPSQQGGYTGSDGAIVVEMRPEAYPNGIPEDMFISGLFTARNASNASRWVHNLVDGVHPMIGYILEQTFYIRGLQGGNGGSAAYVFQCDTQRRSSSNIDGKSFGSKNLLNAIRCLRGEEHEAFFQTSQTVFEYGGYRRDHNFSSPEDDRQLMFGQSTVKNMNSAMSVIDSDIPIVNAYQSSLVYLNTVLSAIYGSEVLKTDFVHGGEALSVSLSRMDTDVADKVRRMFNETRPRYKKKYKVGDEVTIRMDASGSINAGNQYAAQAMARLNPGFNPQDIRMEASGFVPNKTTVEAIDNSRVESIKLTNGCWVHPRYIKLVGVAPNEDQQRTSSIVIGDVMTLNTARGEPVAIRVRDPFENTIRVVRLGQDTRTFGTESSVRESALSH